MSEKTEEFSFQISFLQPAHKLEALSALFAGNPDSVNLGEGGCEGIRQILNDVVNQILDIAGELDERREENQTPSTTG